MTIKRPTSGPRNTSRILGYVLLAASAVLLVVAVILLIPQREALSQVLNTNSTPLPPITCKTPSHTTGTSTLTLTSGGIERSFILHLPPGYGRQPQPLILVFHGYDMTARAMEQMTGLDNLANRANFVVAYPQGVDAPASWNAGVGGLGPTGSADDLQFARDLLKYLKKDYCVDGQRVYASGFSLGAGMAFRVTCALSDQIAALATVSSAIYPFAEDCAPSRPVSVLEVHGSVDNLAPYGGKPEMRMQGIEAYLSGWVARNKCTGEAQTFLQKAHTVGTAWTNCAGSAVVRHYRLANGGHTWYHAPNSPFDIDTSQVFWDFFRSYALNT